MVAGGILLLPVFPKLASYVFGADFVYQFSVAVEFDCSASVASVPEPVVTFFSVGGFVVHKEHVAFFAPHVRDHFICPSPLLHVPDDFFVRFLAVEFCFAARPEF